MTEDGPKKHKHQARYEPVVTRDQERGQVIVEVDKTKSKKPYRFFSYSTSRKVGIAQTAFGGALLSLNSVTMQNVFIEVYTFFIPGLIVIFGGSFAIRASKIKRRKIRHGLMITSVIFSILGFIAAIGVEVRACLIMVATMTGRVNILMLLLQVVAIGAVPVCLLQTVIGIDSVACGRKRTGYSMTMRVVYKIDNDLEMEGKAHQACQTDEIPESADRCPNCCEEKVRVGFLHSAPEDVDEGLKVL